MATAAAAPSSAPPLTPAPESLIGTAPVSPAGPAPDDDAPFRVPPAPGLPRVLQTLRLNQRQIEFVFRSRREIGEVFSVRGLVEDETVVVTSHPDHVRSLFTAPAEIAPSLTGESPLRPIVGPSSVLTLVGPEHMRQRKLLLPPFHGEAVERYAAMIAQTAEREIERWPVGEPFALAPAMNAITLDVIMSGIFGVEGLPAEGTPERRLREGVRAAVALTTRRSAALMEIVNIGRSEPVALTRRLVTQLDRHIYEAITERRRAQERDGAGQGTDILSLLLAARDEDGNPMGDEELRDELITLVLAGHETTANSLAWAFERLLRTPAAYDRLREEVRSGEPDAGAEYIDATIHETMRARPVVPLIGRRVKVPWELGEWRVPAESAVLVSILLLHHRPDVYPDPFAFRPERFLGVKPGTYTWIPFGGGIRRCLGATLAMAEQRVVMRAIAQRTDLQAPDPAPEHARHRNVTMIPAAGAKAILRRRLPA